MVGSNELVCKSCGKRYPLDTRDWRCECGGLFDLAVWPAFESANIDPTQSGLWRYRALLPLDPVWKPVTLGEGNTALVAVDWDEFHIYLKLESMAPTGSFKDRGATVLVTALSGLEIERVVEDSSGNAGASLSAYAARAGIQCEICVPGTAAGPKLAQMAASGAEVIQIKGKRGYAALAEQLGHVAPAALVLPVGNGTLLLGAYRGFQRLWQAGLILRQPRLFAVQVASCAPIFQAFVDGRGNVEPLTCGPTVATGIAIDHPVRGAEILAAVRATNGAVVTVTEDETLDARNQLARHGFYVEETSSVAVAALARLRGLLVGVDPIVVPLTGHGLKTYQSP
jgi:threonine synthase